MESVKRNRVVCIVDLNHWLILKIITNPYLQSSLSMTVFHQSTFLQFSYLIFVSSLISSFSEPLHKVIYAEKFGETPNLFIIYSIDIMLGYSLHFELNLQILLMQLFLLRLSQVRLFP